MGIVSLPSFGSDPATVNAANLDGKVDPLATEFNGSIEDANIKSGAAIANSKLNLTTMAQAIAMSSKEFLWAKGADVVSGTSIALGTDGNCFDITSTTTIQTITAKQAGTVVILHFDGALTLTDNTGNLELQGADLIVAAEDEVILKSDGTNWHLVASSGGVNVASSPTWTGTHDFTGATVSYGLTDSDLPDGSVVQVVNVMDPLVGTTTTVSTPAFDDSIPVKTEGVADMSLAITGGSTNNFFKIDVVWMGSLTVSDQIIVFLLQDAITNSIRSTVQRSAGSAHMQTIGFMHYMAVPSTNEITFKVSSGGPSGDITFNGVSSDSQKLGGLAASSITITEIKGS